MEEANNYQGVIQEADEDTEMVDVDVTNTLFGDRSKFRQKNSRLYEIANLKLKYEDQLESKNQRIEKLQSKNKQYLDIIALREHSFRDLIEKVQMNESQRSNDKANNQEGGEDVTGVGSDPS